MTLKATGTRAIAGWKGRQARSTLGLRKTRSAKAANAESRLSACLCRRQGQRAEKAGEHKTRRQVIDNTKGKRNCHRRDALQQAKRPPPQRLEGGVVCMNLQKSLQPTRLKLLDGPKRTHTNTHKQASRQTNKQKIEEEGRGLLGNYYFHLFIYLFLWLCSLVGLLCQVLERGMHWTFSVSFLFPMPSVHHSLVFHAKK